MDILIVEDDPILNSNISEVLKAEGFQSYQFYDGLLAEKSLRQRVYDCIILDISLPGKSGFDVCREFRTFNASTPVIILTAFSELEDKIKGYEAGADDYLSKPFFMRELILRVNSLLKRAGSKTLNNQKVIVGDLSIDLDKSQVTKQGTEINLTPREYQILKRLAQNPGEIVLKKELIQAIWGTNMEANTNTIEVYINFLRNKIDKPYSTQTIKTKVGYGYYLDAQ
ncbi:response regulator transcription factor [Algoriphagus sp. AGSA1]|uniref:response regulator transcription factor n=1 Tax=Algoriphagus sp. AGSA1 TaxID=2907213 RepID=UPI001F2FC943|nr:response regulator transcription factor [Algoriphagus sp. AGSA1]MCE7055447.1 response regulator transcription factor [Algoriphagus sp. AGSA1]